MAKERNTEETQKDICLGHRNRENISHNVLPNSVTEAHTQRLILEVLLDIRDSINELVNKTNLVQ